MTGRPPIAVVDLVSLAVAALSEVDRERPPDAHVVHLERMKLATHALASRDLGVYFNQVMEAVSVAAGPCPCEACRTLVQSIDPSEVCALCDKPWSEHWGFNCDEPYTERKFRPLRPGQYPPNRGT